MKRVAALPTVAVLALVVGACGGRGDSRLSRASYERAMQSIQPGLASSLASFEPTDFTHVAGYFSTIARRLDGIATTLGAINPPKDVEVFHGRFVDGAKRAANAFRRYAARLRGKSVADVQRLLRQLDSRQLRAALAEIRQAGDAIAARDYRISRSEGT